jgi:hypothetical protein
MGRDPIKIPSQEEQEQDEDWGSKYPDWQKMRWKMFKEPELLIQSIDEPYTLASKAAIANRSTAVTSQQGEEAKKEGAEVKKQEQKAKAPLPKAAATTRRDITKRVLPTKDSVLSTHFEDLQNGVITYLDYKKSYDSDWTAKLLKINIDKIIDNLISTQMSEFKNSYLSINYDINDRYLTAAKKARIQITERTHRYINKLLKDINDNLKKYLTDEIETSEISLIAREIFDSYNFRISAIEDVEFGKAKNLGIALGLKDVGKLELFIDTSSDCINCKNRGAKSILLDNLLIEDLPPFHRACRCELLTEKKIVDMLQLKTEDLKSKNDSCIQKLILKLTTRHPDWKRQKIESMAEEMCTTLDLEKETEE